MSFGYGPPKNKREMIGLLRAEVERGVEGTTDNNDGHSGGEGTVTSTTTTRTKICEAALCFLCDLRVLCG
jgi:hypothetical protein